jgi:hypothetical protein
MSTDRILAAIDQVVDEATACGCGCGRRPGVSMYFASQACQARWYATQADTDLGEQRPKRSSCSGPAVGSEPAIGRVFFGPVGADPSDLRQFTEMGYSASDGVLATTAPRRLPRSRWRVATWLRRLFWLRRDR